MVLKGTGGEGQTPHDVPWGGRGALGTGGRPGRSTGVLRDLGFREDLGRFGGGQRGSGDPRGG